MSSVFATQNMMEEIFMAAITRCDLSPDSFVSMLHYCVNVKERRYESTSWDRIVAHKSHRVIVA